MTDAPVVETPRPPEPTVVFQLALQPDDSLTFQSVLPTPVLIGYLMQIILQIGAPRPKLVVPPTGLGGFRTLLRGRG